MTPYEIAEGELGQAEVPGAGDNPRIVEYMAGAGFPGQHDSTPWCAAFANWCLEQAGIGGTRSLRAKDFLSWGVPIDTPRVGSIVVLDRDGGGHVGFFHSMANGRVMILGGNQGDKVSIAGFPVDRVKGYRWPDQATPPPTSEDHFAAHDDLSASSLLYWVKDKSSRLLGAGGIGATVFAWLQNLSPLDWLIVGLSGVFAVLAFLQWRQWAQRRTALGGSRP